MIAAGCYARVSTAEQVEHGYSITEQQERLRKFCEALGWSVAEVYVDAGFSGANTDRPALQKLIADVKAGKLQKVVVYKLDRLSRSQKDALYLIEDVFLASGCDFVSMSENFDSSTPFGKAALGMIAVFAQLEREQIKERMSMGKLARVRSGKYRGGGARHAVGYDYIDGALVVNEYEKMLVNKVFTLYASGRSLSKIADELNAAGLRHKYGDWNRSTVFRILKSRTYLGEQLYNGEWLSAEHEPIISVELFDAVQRFLDARSSKGDRKSSGLANSYLAGLIFCRQCGARYSLASLTKRYKDKVYHYDRYVCNSRSKKNSGMVKDPDCKNKIWKMDELDALIFAEIEKLALDEEFSVGTEKAPPRRSEAEILRREMEKFDAQILRLLELYSSDGVPLDLLQKKISDLQNKKAELSERLERVAVAAQNRRERVEALKSIKSFAEVLKRADFDETRLLLRELIDRIELDGDDVYIFWRFL